MSSEPRRRSLRLRSVNVQQLQQKDELQHPVKPAPKAAAPKRRSTAAAAADYENDAARSPEKKKSTAAAKKGKKQEKHEDPSKDTEMRDASSEAEGRGKPSTLAALPPRGRRANGKVMKKEEEKKKDEDDDAAADEPAAAAIDNGGRTKRRSSLAAAKAVKSMVSKEEKESEEDEEFDIEDEMRNKKEAKKTKVRSDDGKGTKGKSQTGKTMKKPRRRHIDSSDEEMEEEGEEEKEKATAAKKPAATRRAKESLQQVLQGPERVNEKVRLLRDKKYEVDRDEMLSWEKRAVQMAREIRKLETDASNNSSKRMKEVMEKVHEFVERCLKDRKCEMGEVESVRACYVLEGEFEEDERKKKMTITQRIKEKVDNERKEMTKEDAEEADESGASEKEEDDEWEEMETVDGEGAVKSVQVKVDNRDMSSHWKSKWLKQEVNRGMRTRCENMHKVHLLSYMVHLRNLATMALSVSSKQCEIPLAAIALSMLPDGMRRKEKEGGKKKRGKGKKAEKADDEEEWKALVEWWRAEFKRDTDSEMEESEGEENSEEELVSDRMMERRWKSEKEAAVMFFSLAASAGFTTRIICRAEVITKKVPESEEARELREKEGEKQDKSKRKKEEEDARPVDAAAQYWIEMWNEREGTWRVVDIRPQDEKEPMEEVGEGDGEIPHKEPLNSCMEKGGTVLYFLAIDNEFGMRDVSARYVHPKNFVSKEFRGRRAGAEWIAELWEMEPFHCDPTRAAREDDEWLTSMQVEMPKMVGEFKDHPLYVLDKDVLKMQRIFPYDTKELGEVRGYKIYSRAFLRPTNTAKWYEKMGRQVRPDEPPVGEKRLTNPLAGTTVMQSLFGYWQTDPWNGGKVEEGRVPRNEFDNVYMYQPREMCPEGGVYIIPQGIQKVARELGRDYVQAVIGWQYKQGKLMPIIKGAVFAREDLPELIGAWKECERRWKEEEKKARTDRALTRWKKLIKGMLRLAAMRKEFEPIENKKKKGTKLGDEAVRAEEAAAWPQQRYGGDLFEG